MFNIDDFPVSPIPDGYYVDDNNCLMLISEDAPFCEFCESAQLDDAVDGDFCKCQRVTFHLTKANIDSVICGLQWSINHHKSLPDSAFDDDYDERAEVLKKISTLKSMFINKLGGCS